MVVGFVVFLEVVVFLFMIRLRVAEKKRHNTNVVYSEKKRYREKDYCVHDMLLLGFAQVAICLTSLGSNVVLV